MIEDTKPVQECYIDWNNEQSIVEGCSKIHEKYFITCCESTFPDYNQYQIDFIGSDGKRVPFVSAVFKNDYTPRNVREMFYGAINRGKNFRFYSNYTNAYSDSVYTKGTNPNDDILLWGYVEGFAYIKDRVSATDFNELIEQMIEDRKRIQKEIIKATKER